MKERDHSDYSLLRHDLLALGEMRQRTPHKCYTKPVRAHLWILAWEDGANDLLLALSLERLPVDVTFCIAIEAIEPTWLHLDFDVHVLFYVDNASTASKPPPWEPREHLRLL